MRRNCSQTLRLNFILFVLQCLFGHQLFGQDTLPTVCSGKIIRLENFRSAYVNKRHIDIWLPPDYNRDQQYDVLYMQDGQMLYDANTTWNKQAWEIDETASALFRNDSVKQFIVVGIWNDGKNRHADYLPEDVFNAMNDVEKDSMIAQLRLAGRTQESFKPHSNNYLKFITKEVKPYIDQNFSVNTQAEHTFIAGSSMGALISIYALCKYPTVFGGAICMSTHWPGSFTLKNNGFPLHMINYLALHSPYASGYKPKIYFDCGDQTLDALYRGIQKQIDSTMVGNGLATHNLYLSQFYPGENHSEQAWRKRLHVPLEFIFLRP